MHHMVPRDPAASGPEQLEAIWNQFAADREHMAMLKAAVEQVHATQAGLAADLSVEAGRQDGQVILNTRLAGDIAALRGVCKEHAGVVEEQFAYNVAATNRIDKDLHDFKANINESVGAIMVQTLPTIIDAKLVAIQADPGS